jgi:hypothetical protein
MDSGKKIRDFNDMARWAKSQAQRGHTADKKIAGLMHIPSR